MVREKVTLRNKTGLHARPAATLVKTAGKYQAKIELVYADKTLRAKGMAGLLGAGIVGGSEVELICDGLDEQQAFDDIKQLFENGFGEE